MNNEDILNLVFKISNNISYEVEDETVTILE